MPPIDQGYDRIVSALTRVVVDDAHQADPGVDPQLARAAAVLAGIEAGLALGVALPKHARQLLQALDRANAAATERPAETFETDRMVKVGLVVDLLRQCGLLR